MKKQLLLAAILLYCGPCDAMRREQFAPDDDDEVAAAIMADDARSRIQMLMEDHLEGVTLSDTNKEALQEQLAAISEDGFKRILQNLQTTRSHRRRMRSEDKVAAVLKEVVAEMKEQTEQMKGSGEIQQAAYDQQIKSANNSTLRWRIGFALSILTLITSNAIWLIEKVNDSDTPAC